MKRRVIALTAVCALGAAAFPLPASAGEVAELIQKLPAQNRDEMEEIAGALVDLGAEGVKALAAMLVEPDARRDGADDVKARYALHALAIHVTRPGAEGERSAFARALARELGGDYPNTVKGFLVRQLQLAGSAEASEALAGLLSSDDHDLCEYATQALLRISGRSAEPFRKAFARAGGKNRLTIMQALGVLKDTASVRAILRSAEDPDREVRLSALWALGNIGDPRAATTLEQALRKATAVESPYERAKAMDALLLFAKRLVEGGRRDEAGRIYRNLWEGRGAKGPSEVHVRCASLRGLALALGGEAMAELRASMKSDDIQIRAVATEAAVSTPGEGITLKWVEQMRSDDPAVRAGTLNILARRRDRIALPAVLDAMKDREEAVKLAAIRASASLGGRDAIPPLIAMLAGPDAPEKKAAEGALRQMPGDDATAAIVDSLGGAPPTVRGPLLGILAARGAKEHVELVIDYAHDEDESVRAAAIGAAGALADEKSLPLIVGLLVAAKTDGVRGAAEKAVAAVCGRARDKDACVDALLGELVFASPKARCSLLRVLGRLGGERSLAAVRDAAGDGNADVRDAAVRSLADWPDAAAAEALLSIVRTSDNMVHRVLALRGYVRAVGLLRDRPVEERLAMYRGAMAVAPRHEDKKLVLSGLGEVAHVDALRMAGPYLDDAALRAEAASAVAKIARAIGKAHKDEAMAALQKILRVATSEGVKRQAKDSIDFIQRFEDYVTDWMVAGPYSKGHRFNTAYPPELPEGPPPAGGSPEREKVKWIRWTGEGDRPWFVDFKRIKNVGGDNRAAYLRADVFSPGEAEVRFEFGSDDGIKVWLNGKVIHSKDVPRGFTEAEDKVNATLKEGWNKLLLKIVQGGGDWSAAARVRAADGTKLKGIRMRAE